MDTSYCRNREYHDVNLTCVTHGNCLSCTCLDTDRCYYDRILCCVVFNINNNTIEWIPKTLAFNINILLKSIGLLKIKITYVKAGSYGQMIRVVRTVDHKRCMFIDFANMFSFNNYFMIHSKLRDQDNDANSYRSIEIDMPYNQIKSLSHYPILTWRTSHPFNIM